ncbi:hypothetical protein KIPB_011751, partial [Kipferlia bialata]
DVSVVNGLVVVYRRFGDLCMCVCGPADANELFLLEIASSLVSAIQSSVESLDRAGVEAQFDKVCGVILQLIDSGDVVGVDTTAVPGASRGSGREGGFLGGAKFIARTLLS